MRAFAPGDQNIEPAGPHGARSCCAVISLPDRLFGRVDGRPKVVQTRQKGGGKKVAGEVWPPSSDGPHIGALYGRIL